MYIVFSANRPGTSFNVQSEKYIVYSTCWGWYSEMIYKLIKWLLFHAIILNLEEFLKIYR